MTDHEGDVVVDLGAQRRIRAKQAKALNRLLRDMEAMQKKETAISLSITTVRDRATELTTYLRRATRSMDLIYEAEDNEENLIADEKVRLDINQAAEQIRNLCQDLVTSKKAFILAESIEQALADMDDLRAAEADTDCSACLPAIQKQLNEMIDLLTDSTIKQTDGLWVKAKTLKTRLLKATTHKKEDSKPITIIRAESDKNFDMPKIHIAKFKGGLEEWHVFWGRFRGAVHMNEKLAEHIKLAHLTDLVIDPALHDFMVTANDGTPGRYQEAVDYLQECFNRPRELHSIYCRKLSELQPIKGTPAELSAAADTVFAAVSGIRRSGQACIDQIATSLVAPILPDHLRALWENKTEEDPQVPHIDQWIAFVRKKATMADKSQKAPSSTLQPQLDPSRIPRNHRRTMSSLRARFMLPQVNLQQWWSLLHPKAGRNRHHPTIARFSVHYVQPCILYFSAGNSWR